MSKLYKVTASIEDVIEVCDGELPDNVAVDTFRDACHDTTVRDVDFMVNGVETAAALPDMWNIKCFPYRADGTTSKRIEEFLE